MVGPALEPFHLWLAVFNPVQRDWALQSFKISRIFSGDQQGIAALSLPAAELPDFHRTRFWSSGQMSERTCGNAWAPRIFGPRHRRSMATSIPMH